MDKKISEFVIVTVLDGTELVPLAKAPANQVISTLNLSKAVATLSRVISAPIGTVIPVTALNVLIPVSIPAYTLGAGTNGQEITILSDTVNVVTFSTGTATFSASGSITLMYVVSLTKWIPLSTVNVVLS
jgi:hypothetical protein